MMRAWAFAGRCTKEIVRDPIALFFGIVFPVMLLLLLTAINRNVPGDVFSIEQLTPGIAVFSLSFIALFAAQTLAKDRSSAYLIRLLTTPMNASDFITGYTLPLLLLALLQSVTCFVAAYALGMSPSLYHIGAFAALVVTSMLFIAIGLLCGSLLSEKAAVGLCGALLTNVTAVLSGAWFDVSLIGGLFEKIAYMLPFIHAVDIVRAIVVHDMSAIFPHVYVVLAYGVVLVSLSIFVFKHNIQQQ